MTLFKQIYGLIFILLFFSAFVIFFIPNSGFFYIVGTTLAVALLFIIFCLYNKKYYIFLKESLKTKPIKILLILCLYIISVWLIHYFLIYLKLPISYYLVRLPRFFIYLFSSILFPITGLFLGIKFKNIIKLFYISIMIILLAGFIQYFSFLFNIRYIDYLFDFFTNLRIFYEFPDSCKENMRIFSIFGEPSAFGQYIFIITPYIVALTKSKYKLFKNNYINLLFKKSFIPILISDIVFTKSPIYLILCFIEILILLCVFHYKLIKKLRYFIVSIILTIILIIILQYSILEKSVSDSFLYRIINTIYSFGNFNKLIFLEPSLATRIIYYYNHFLVFKQNLLFGCGFYNADIYLNHSLLSSSLPVTPEVITRYYNTSYSVGTAYSLIWTSLAEFGLVGISLYISFVISNISKLKKCLSLYSGIEKVFCLGTLFSIIAMFIISFYNLSFDSTLVWIIYGLSLLCIVNAKIIRGNNV